MKLKRWRGFWGKNAWKAASVLEFCFVMSWVVSQQARNAERTENRIQILHNSAATCAFRWNRVRYLENPRSTL
jgi:hypothetical protein